MIPPQQLLEIEAQQLSAAETKPWLINQGYTGIHWYTGIRYTPTVVITKIVPPNSQEVINLRLTLHYRT